MTPPTALIGIDWGSTVLRAYRFDGSGQVLETREFPSGIVNIQDGEFEAAFAVACGDWIAAAPDASILMSGMIGSRQGWIEAPYVNCVADLTTVAARLTRVRSDVATAWIVPGVATQRGTGVHDVMRGEETQVFGAIDASTSAVVIAPGTHSKWIRVEAGNIVTFRTFITGELCAVLRTHSVLGRMMTGTWHDAEAFARGVRVALDGDLAGDLFSVRTEGLFASIAPTALASYLSGLLIGSEIFSATLGPNKLATLAADTPIKIIGTATLANSYREALIAAGIEQASPIDAHEASARGLWNIAAHALQLKSP